MGKLDKLLEKFQTLFPESPKGPRACSMGQHVIDTTTAQVAKDNIWPIAKKWEKEIKNQIEEMDKYGIIEKSFSPYNQNIILADKKEVRGERFCVDFRSLKKKTTKYSSLSQMSTSCTVLLSDLVCFLSWILLRITGRSPSAKMIEKKRFSPYLMVNGRLSGCPMVW